MMKSVSSFSKPVITQKSETKKFFASVNNAHYNMSFKINAKDKVVDEFSIGYTLRENKVNKQSDEIPSKAKSKTATISSYSLYYSFVNVGRISDFSNLQAIPKWQKFVVYKNLQTIFYGVMRTDTTKINLKSEKAIEILLLLQNIYNQIQDNEKRIESLQKNKKSFPYDPTLQVTLDTEIEQKSKLKDEFIYIVRNMLKRYF